MPKTGRTVSIDKAVRAAMAPIVARASQTVARAIADLAAIELERRLAKAAKQSRSKQPRGAGRRRPKGEMTKWVADRRARRVPTFVIEATGLKTKKKIVAKFGENASFQKGEPLPPLKVSVPARLEPSVVKARPPVVRKAGAK